MPAGSPVVGLRSTLRFVGIYFLTTAVRAILIAVLPLQAFELLGSAQYVSVVYLVVGVFGIVVTVLIPQFVARLSVHAVFVAGVVLATLAPVLLATALLPLFLVGMVLQVGAIACLEVAMSLYVLQRVPRRELSHFEPIRVLFTGSAFIIGPWTGVYLESQVAHWVPFALTSALGAGAYLYMRALGLHKLKTRSAQSGAGNPAHYLMRFVAQPRMRLAWGIAFSRNGWWNVFFIYTPIFAVTQGLSEVAAGAVVSFGTAAIYLAPFWGWVARRYGMRRLLIWGFGLTGAVTPLVLIATGSPLLGAAILIAAAVAASICDGAGHVAFYRAVKPSQRSEMTSGYLTYRDVSQLVPPGIFALLLSVFPVASVFVFTGGWMLGMAWFSRYVPRRM